MRWFSKSPGGSKILATLGLGTADKKARREAEAEQAERIEQGGSSDLRTHPATSTAEHLARARADMKERNLEKWRSRNAQRQ